MTESRITVSKRDAATHQLETAIKLYLENRDLISAYTLCCASDGILQGIYENERDEIIQKQRNEEASVGSVDVSWREELENQIRPEYKNEVFRVLNSPQNFFKHADRDHDSSQKFADWELTGVRIIMTVRNYNIVFLEITAVMNVYSAWYAMLHPDLLVEGSPLRDTLASLPDIKSMSEGLTRGDIAAIGYSALKANCPELFKEPSIVGNIL